MSNVIEAYRPGAIRTYSGIMFHPLDPDPATIHIEDIAHGLANTGRYSGQAPKFYSVAEHCVRAAKHVGQVLGLNSRYQLMMLLHDASEAYLTDVPHPIKSGLTGYREIEDRLLRKVMDVWGLTNMWENEASFLEIDFVDKSIMYSWEIRDFWNGPAEWAAPEEREAYESILPHLPTEVIKPWSPQKAERKFLNLYWQLVDQINEEAA